MRTSSSSPSPEAQGLPVCPADAFLHCPYSSYLASHVRLVPTTLTQSRTESVLLNISSSCQLSSRGFNSAVLGTSSRQTRATFQHVQQRLQVMESLLLEGTKFPSQSSSKVPEKRYESLPSSTNLNTILIFGRATMLRSGTAVSTEPASHVGGGLLIPCGSRRQWMHSLQ